MNIKWLSAAALALALAGCAKDTSKAASAAAQPAPGQEKAQAAEPAEAGEIKLPLAQTPEPARKTIERELVGGSLEDISKKTVNGQTIYEVDIIKGGKRELWVAEDGKIIHNIAEGGEEEKAADRIESPSADDQGFRKSFDVSKSNLAPTGDNPFITMRPGRVSKLIDKNGDTLTITILPDTMEIDGVKVGVLEERETKDHKLVEISRNFFATDKNTGDVYYFGEDVDNYKDGKVINHESAWRAGEKGAQFGLQIPAKPQKGQKFYQEIAPKVAMDRVEVVSTDESVKTPAGTFQHCVHLKETTPLEADVSHKYYAPGVGMIKDDDFELAIRS